MSKQIFICVVRLAIEADTSSEAEDAVSNLLGMQTQNIDPTSSLLDWNYDEWGSPVRITVKEDFGIDSVVPQLPGRDVRAS